MLGVLNLIMNLISINQALGHPKMRFSWSRPTEFSFIHPPQTVPKMGSFTSRARQGTSGTPPPPNVGVLNSIFSSIHINKALQHPKMRFSRVQTDRSSVYPPPFTSVLPTYKML